jgi:NarL family two-component system sensor histidine kinase LiaS
MITNNNLKRNSDELRKTNNKLNEANERIQESLEQIMSMYQAVEILTSRDDELSFQTFADYTLMLTKAKNAFFYHRTLEQDSGIISISGMIDDNTKEELVKNIEVNWKDYIYSLNELEINLSGHHYVAIPVQSSSNFYGLVGADVENDVFEKDNLKILKFISDLSAVILERFELDIISERLAKAEEQNRIANEMHDSVSQSLFSISCATHLLANNLKKFSQEQLEEKLISLQETSNAAMKELRSTIYKLSTKKGGSSTYIDDINKYLNNISKLNNVNIDFQFSGDEEMLDIQRKKGLYRIISESTSNAIRHGKCSTIKVNYTIEDNETYLTVQDDGKGFDVDSINCDNSGLGLRNMTMLINSYNGEIDINSKIGAGTVIEIKIPNRSTYKKLEGMHV